MPPMRRRVFNLAISLSLLLWILTAIWYLRAFSVRDELQTSVFRHHCIVVTFPHHLHLLVAGHARDKAQSTSIARGLEQYPSHPKYLQPRLSSTGVYWEISTPFWLTLLFIGAIPLWAAGRAWKRRSRLGAGHCPTCGYDLRATPEKGEALLAKCPECGTAAAEC